MNYDSNYPSYPPESPDDVAEPNWQVQLKPDTAYQGELLNTPAPKHARARTILKIAALALGLLACAALIVFGGAYVALAGTLPTPEQLASAHLGQSTRIFDRNGGLLFEIFDSTAANGGRHTLITPEQIPLVLKQATIATEDPSFYTNLGVDPYAVARAIYYDVRYQSIVSGGSTITQQLIKNAALTPEQTIQRKVREAILAIETTRRYSKEQILAFYLNTVFYGNLSYGIQAASQSYFHKDVSQLNLAEASLLAGLPQAPAWYDPCQDPDAALDRQKTVLGLMKKQGYVTDEQIAAAEAEMDKLLHSDEFGKHCATPLGIVAPHFVDYVRQQLEQKYGPEVVYKGGLQVYTTLDPTMQKIAEEEARKQIAAIKKNNVTSTALVAASPQTGEIYAMLGSVDFFDKNIDGQVNVATSLRQPGSAIKPINYVTALQKGWTPATPILDLTTQFPNGNQPPYVPVNYDGKEHGQVTLRVALDNSLNIPAVKTLYFVGVKEMIATAQKMGITTFNDPNRYGLALTLGGGEVKLIELTGAYAVLANGGTRAPLTPYRKIVDGQGNTLLDTEKNRPKTEKALDPRHAYLITNILSDNASRALAFGLNSPLHLCADGTSACSKERERPVAAKTGTTNDFKDNWTMGYTPELVVGVWVGNARNTAMKGVTGVTGAAPIWHNVMARVYKEDEQFKTIAPHPFAVPDGLVQTTVCNESGLLPTDLCPVDHRHTEIFVAEQAPKEQDNVWVKLKIDKTNNLLANDQCLAEDVEERVFQKMPHDVGDLIPYDQIVKWANDHGIPQPPTDASPCTAPPTPVPTTEIPLSEQVKIISPRDGSQVNGQIQVVGTATITDFDSFVVELGQENQWQKIGGGTVPVMHGVLALDDTRKRSDGTYTIRLTVLNQSDQSFQDEIQVTIDNHPVTVTPRPTKSPTAITTPTPTRTPQTGNGVGPGTYAFNDPSIVYAGNWARSAAAARSGQTGDTAALTISGATSVALTFVGGPSRGIAEVQLDGVVIATFDSYRAAATNVVAGPFALPDQESHTLTVRVTGAKNSASSSVTIALANIIVNGAGQ